ncbi:LysR family transcriptional regulator [Bradyrhizobium sp.]|jgi:DNA-binding transcriptional LysR family regulator|uniref:LysR family transcriptional regulator n=1 Tax=Bradyrhizobium sp. TaxID=376 RepID=UPI002D487E8D|nr:LysR family transcriptional regulator [Bradyrhizobium sp.]HZR77263.1 LysR family transcriptional regulator [Bradyrhizobium sp.]
MHLAVERGVPLEERKATTAGLPDWDAARIFLEVVRCGSFRSAAERLGLSINVVRRRIDDFERQTGATLFTRDVHGARLTEDGAAMVSAVERMEAASFELLRASDGVANALSGEIRVAVTEGLGTFWLAPRLVEFQQSFPNILVDLYCAMRSADVSRHEADVAIHLSRPSALDVKMVRLGRMHMNFFASQKYLETREAPRSLEEMRRHRLVLQVADEAAAKEAFESVFPGYAQRDLLVMKTNVSSANYWAVANGAGIGVFPTYALALGGKLVPLDVDLRWSFDIWLSYHPTSGRIPRVRQMIDWLIEAFNPAKYPWFRDEFIHPRELKAVYMGTPLTHLFGGFSTEGR